MLVLTRKVGEAIVIGGDIRVVVSKIKGSSAVRLGIETKDGIHVVREELLKNETMASNANREEENNHASRGS